MNDERKTKAQLIRELRVLRAKAHRLKKSEERRRLVEQALRESEERFRGMADSTQDGLAIIESGKVVYVNSRACEIFGYPREELLAMTGIDIAAPEERERLQQIREHAKRKETALRELEFWIVQKNGSRRYIQNRYFTMSKDRYSVITSDITERKLAEEASKRAEETLRESEELYRSLVEAAPDVVYTISAEDGSLTSLNPAFETITGWSRAEWLGKPFMGIVHPDDRSAAVETFQKALRGESPPLYQVRILSKSGEYLVGEFTSTPHVKGGKVVGELGIGRDITERKKAAAELATANDRLAHDLESMTRLHILGTLLVREGGMHAALQEMLDVAIAVAHADMGNIQLLDRQSGTLKIGAHRGFEQPFLDFWDSVLEGQGACGTALERGERVIVEDVSQSPIFVSSPAMDVQLAAGVRAVLSTPLIGRSGKLIGICSTHFRTPHRPDEQTLHLLDLHARQVADIIERARAEEALRTAKTRLQRLSHRLLEVQENERRALARELHDEIGQILTAAKIDLQGIRRRLIPEDTAARLDENITVLDRCLQQLRELSLDLRPSLLDDLGLVAALRWHLDRQAQRAGFNAQLDVDGAERRLNPDLETACFRIVQEGLTNIVKSAHARNVFVNLRFQESEINISLRDDGEGFDVEEAMHSASHGMTFGILGMQERVALLGGTFDIKSAPRCGTTIKLRFPLGATMSSEPQHNS